MKKKYEEKIEKEPEELPEAPGLEEEGSGESDVELVDLVAELAKAREEAETLRNALTRERADFTNYRRLVENEKNSAGNEYRISMLQKILPILDDLELAIRNRVQDGAEPDTWAEGIEMIARKYRALVEAEGVKPSAAVGEPFDPRFHQAISQEENPDVESGTILEVLSSGYILGDRALKTALVRVAA